MESTVDPRKRILVDFLDFTLLDANATSSELDDFIEKANTVMPAAVCVFAKHVEYVKKLLSPGILLAAVAGGFPVGDESAEELSSSILAAVAAGVDEIDFVLEPRLSPDFPGVHEEQMIRAARKACGKCTLKIILEISLLSEESMVAVSDLALECGVDFLKTSTGKRGGATVESARVLTEAIKRYEEATGNKRGIKLSGGIRTVDDAYALLDVVRDRHDSIALARDGVFCREDNARIRIGASSLLKELLSS